MDVFIDNKQSALTLSTSDVEALAQEIVAFEGHSFNEVTIHFVDIEEISELHNKFFQDPTPTDCISLPMDSPNEPGYKVLGEIFVCPKIAIEYGDENGGDAYMEVSLYIVHGLLHLMGYKDDFDNVVTMQQAEQKHLQNLESKGLILTRKEESCN